MSEERTIDVRWLEPPEPFERVLIHREPHPLYRWLARERYHYRVRFDDEGWFEIRITR